MNDELMKLYVPLRLNREDGVVMYEDAPLVRFLTRPDAIMAALDLVATFKRMGRPVEVYVQDQHGAWHLVSGDGRISRPGAALSASEGVKVDGQDE